MENETLITIDDFNLVTPSGKKLLEKVCFKIVKGKVTLLIAGNGVGKTQFMGELLKLDSKKIQTKIQRKDIGHLPQVETLKLKIPFNLGELCSTQTSYFGKELQGRSWNVASGGEKKRALLARTLTQERSLYILDEPLNHLDKKTQNAIRDEVLKMCEEGKTILMTGHIDLSIKSQLVNTVELEQWRC
jgi:ABC-type Mn2+/Zn2+ transport system ATPase subunit